MNNCCNKCKSENIHINGIFYVCKDCNDVDDSTFNMIIKDMIPIKEGGRDE